MRGSGPYRLFLVTYSSRAEVGKRKRHTQHATGSSTSSASSSKSSSPPSDPSAMADRSKASKSARGFARSAAHRGSWYSDHSATLGGQLQTWLRQAQGPARGQPAHSFPLLPTSPLPTPSQPPLATTRARALIGPHAGYRYSGETAGHAYQYLASAQPRPERIFILGPSHHVGLTGCAVSAAGVCETPLGDLKVDTAIVDALLKASPPARQPSRAPQTADDDEDSMDFDDDPLDGQPLFRLMSKAVDEAEHSLEMQYPYIVQAMAAPPKTPKDKPLTDFTVVPIMVGQVPGQVGELVGEVLAPFFDDPKNFFIISSDFCHWGERFNYTHYVKAHGEIYQSIEALDKEGMAAIVSAQPSEFRAYLKRTKNTICGRNPILCLLHTIQLATTKAGMRITFVRYAQSSQCRDPRADSSVSYAAGVIHS